MKSKVLIDWSWFFFGLACLLLVVGTAAPAWAESQGDKESGNPFAPFRGDLTLWTIVTFGILLVVLRKAAWGPMLEGLQKREQSIVMALEEAKRAQAETQRVTAEYEAKIVQATAEVSVLLEQGKRDAQRLAEEVRAKALAEIQVERQRMRREIDLAKDHALEEIWKQAAQLATLISAKALRREVNADDHRRLIDEALVELRARGKQ